VFFGVATDHGQKSGLKKNGNATTLWQREALKGISLVFVASLRDPALPPAFFTKLF
jgi:hypothetical protein